MGTEPEKRLDEAKIEILRIWGEGLGGDPREEVKAAGRAITMSSRRSSGASRPLNSARLGSPTGRQWARASLQRASSQFGAQRPNSRTWFASGPGS